MRKWLQTLPEFFLGIKNQGEECNSEHEAHFVPSPPTKRHHYNKSGRTKSDISHHLYIKTFVLENKSSNQRNHYAITGAYSSFPDNSRCNEVRNIYAD